MPVQGEKGQNICHGLDLTPLQKGADLPSKQLHQYYFYRVGSIAEASSAA